MDVDICADYVVVLSTWSSSCQHANNIKVVTDDVVMSV